MSESSLPCAVTDEMVNRFLSWPLPKSVAADRCATKENYPYPRSGTSLLTATEARKMLEHVLGLDDKLNMMLATASKRN